MLQCVNWVSPLGCTCWRKCRSHGGHSERWTQWSEGEPVRPDRHSYPDHWWQAGGWCQRSTWEQRHTVSVEGTVMHTRALLCTWIESVVVKSQRKANIRGVCESEVFWQEKKQMCHFALYACTLLHTVSIYTVTSIYKKLCMKIHIHTIIKSWQ